MLFTDAEKVNTEKIWYFFFAYDKNYRTSP